MVVWYYLDVELKLRDESHAILTAAYFQGAINNSLDEFFGEIGGNISLELVKFHEKRAILRVPEEFYSRARSAITLIGHYQDIPCSFQILKASKEVLDF